MRRCRFILGVLAASLPLGSLELRAADRPPTGLGDPGKPVSLTLHGGENAIVLRGPDARLQLLATAEYDSGQARDWTDRVQYQTAPEGVARITSDGLVIPLADGAATITAEQGGLRAQVKLAVERFADPPPVNFVNQVVPIFSKLGCNGGGCHGKSGGQNGFSLSLFGYEPWKDYEYLVKESRGRRLFPAAPDSSLLLLKATNTLPHGGGQRITEGSVEYRLIRRWIAQGMPYGSKEDPSVVAIQTIPDRRTMALDGRQQVKVLARYSDGRTEDVTQTAQYEPNDKDLADVDASGRVKVLGVPGDVAVMVRYQSFVGTFRATVPLGAAVSAESLPAPRNFIDERVFTKLRELGVPPSAPCDDATFLRRVTLDLTGRLPETAEARKFLADPAADKRDRLVDDLLNSEAYADYFAGKWASILRNKRSQGLYKEGNYAFHQWVRGALLANKPYDIFVRDLLTASGHVGDNPPAAWYRQVNESHERVEDTAQLFMGVRIQCARCHHHPFEKWSQDDYYGLAAFFSTVAVKTTAPDDYNVLAKRAVAQAQNPATGLMLKPAALGQPPLALASEQDPRRSLADWLGNPENPFFARSLVNRYWKHFFNRGLVEPEDDMRDTNPPANPQLLDALAAHFVKSGYDMKDLIRTICRSRVYQLSAIPNEYNAGDRQAFSRYYPRRMPAEVLLDAIDRVNATATEFKGLPRGTLAVQLPDHAPNTEVYFMAVFGRPAGASACECERTTSTSLAQSLHLINSADLQAKLSHGRAKTLAADGARSDAEKVAEVYLLALSRAPTESESQIALAHIGKTTPDKKHEAYEDILWAMVNTKEFLFNH